MSSPEFSEPSTPQPAVTGEQAPVQPPVITAEDIPVATLQQSEAAPTGPVFEAPDTTEADAAKAEAAAIESERVAALKARGMAIIPQDGSEVTYTRFSPNGSAAEVAPQPSNEPKRTLGRWLLDKMHKKPVEETIEK